MRERVGQVEGGRGKLNAQRIWVGLSVRVVRAARAHVSCSRSHSAIRPHMRAAHVMPALIAAGAHRCQDHTRAP